MIHISSKSQLSMHTSMLQVHSVSFHLSSIAGASQVLQPDKNAAEIGGDAVEDTQWKIFKVTEGE